MNNIDEKIEAAWQKTHFDEVSYDPNYPIKASKNFADGFKAGAQCALSDRWLNTDEDELPEDANDVLLFCRYCGICLGYYDDPHWTAYGIGYVKGVTHWMPLPPKPENQPKLK